MKDGKRLDKIIDRGNIGQTQASILRNVHGAGKKDAASMADYSVRRERGIDLRDIVFRHTGMAV